MALRSSWLQGDVLVLLGVFLLAALALVSSMSWSLETTPRAFVTGSFVYPVDDAPAQAGARIIGGSYCCSPLQIEKSTGCPADPIAVMLACVPLTTQGCGNWVRC